MKGHQVTFKVWDGEGFRWFLRIYSISVAHNDPVLGMNSLAIGFHEVRFVNGVLLFLNKIPTQALHKRCFR